MRSTGNDGGWQAAKDEVRRILIERARNRETIAYSELTSLLRAVGLALDSDALATLLREISTEEDAAGRGMLSAVVVHGKGNRMPGVGFFRLAESLGRDTKDRRVFWSNELEKVYEDWQLGDP